MTILIANSMRDIHTTLQTFDGHTYTGNDEILAKRASDMLNRHYPGHLWAVNVNSEKSGGVMVIKNYRISYRYGFTLHLSKLDPELKKVMRAGGEFLERARMRRGLSRGDMATHVEGVADKHQPIAELGIII